MLVCFRHVGAFCMQVESFSVRLHGFFKCGIFGHMAFHTLVDVNNGLVGIVWGHLVHKVPWFYNTSNPVFLIVLDATIIPKRFHLPHDVTCS